MNGNEIQQSAAMKREGVKRESCITCANCVKVGGAYYCEVSGELLVSCHMNIGYCPRGMSDYRKKEERSHDDTTKKGD